MYRRTVVVTPPDPLLTALEARQHIKVDSDFEDKLIEAYIQAATAHIDGPDGWLGRALGPQTLEQRRDTFCDGMVLRYSPVRSVASVKYLDADNAEQTLSTSVYGLVDDRVILKDGQSWPSTYSVAEAVRIQYAAGWAAKGDVPMPIRVAILMMVADLYRNRETTAYGAPTMIPMSTTVDALLTPYRRQW